MWDCYDKCRKVLLCGQVLWFKLGNSGENPGMGVFFCLRHSSLLEALSLL